MKLTLEAIKELRDLVFSSKSSDPIDDLDCNLEHVTSLDLHLDCKEIKISICLTTRYIGVRPEYAYISTGEIYMAEVKGRT